MAFKHNFPDLNNSNMLKDPDVLLNTAFIGSPNKSISFLYNNSSTSDLSLQLYYGDEKTDSEIGKEDSPKKNQPSQIQEISKQPLERGKESNSDVFFHNELSGSGLNPYEVLGQRSLSTVKSENSSDFQSKPYLRHGKNYLPKIDLNSIYPCISAEEFAEVSSEETNCSTPCTKAATNEFSDDSASTSLSSIYFKFYGNKSAIEASTIQSNETDIDLEDFDRNYRPYFETRNASKKLGPKTESRYQQPSYVYHELSTINELSALSTDAIDEFLISSSECNGLGVEDSNRKQNSKCFNTSARDTYFEKSKTSKLPPNLFKMMQSKRFDRLLQERGILEESDLTLVSNDYSTTSKYLENSREQSKRCNPYKLPSPDAMDSFSPSLLSFLQHEISCMRE